MKKCDFVKKFCKDCGDHCPFFEELERRKNIMQYEILEAHSGPDLVLFMKKAIEDGWRPFGNLSVIRYKIYLVNDKYDINYLYTQAIIKE